MIAIVNKRRAAGRLHRYEVRINHKPICRFSHKREDGLARCLELAAQAVKQAELTDMLRTMKCLDATKTADSTH